MRKLYELKDSLCEKLEEYNGKEVTTSTLEIMEKLSSTIKNIGKILMMSEEESNYSNRGYSNYEGGSYNNSYNSFARGRNARRDSMGRYSRDDGYSRDDMSGMVNELREMANQLPANKQRDMERLIQQMENM